MGSKLSPRDNELYQRCDEVLHYIWDPIGVSTHPEARDEYHSYLPQVFGMIKANSGADSIASCLTMIAVERMGLKEARGHDLDVASLLLCWRDVIHEKYVDK